MDGPARRTRRGEAVLCAYPGYRVGAGVWQPHWQFSWQWHAFFWQPQEPVSQPQPQLDFAVFSMVGFFTLDIVFLLFSVVRVMRFHRG
jgi:hypothetical protein